MTKRIGKVGNQIRCGDLIRCAPDSRVTSELFKEWHVIVKITRDSYHVEGPGYDDSIGEWTRDFEHFEFGLAYTRQSVI